MSGPLEQRTLNDRISEAIRCAGIEWKQQNDPSWRDKPWKDGISVDLDENDVLEALTAGVGKVLAESELWT